MTDLFPYQRIGADFLANRKRGLLTDKPGLGKTVQAIRAIDLVTGRQPARALIVCPASIVTNWTREIERWRTGTWDATVMSYDRLVRHGIDYTFDFAVVDEAHYCKTADAKRTKAALVLAKKAGYAWGLTGTPAPNGPHELFTLLRVFAPDVLRRESGGHASYMQFINRYCTTAPTDG